MSKPPLSRNSEGTGNVGVHQQQQQQQQQQRDEEDEYSSSILSEVHQEGGAGRGLGGSFGNESSSGATSNVSGGRSIS
jgi:hypothetical protein